MLETIANDSYVNQRSVKSITAIIEAYRSGTAGGYMNITSIIEQLLTTKNATRPKSISIRIELPLEQVNQCLCSRKTKMEVTKQRRNWS